MIFLAIIFFVDVFAVTFTIDVVVTAVISTYVYVAIAVAVGYCGCRNNVVKLLGTVVTVNIVLSVDGTTVNVTKYIIILIYFIIGVGDGVGGG